MDDRSRKTRTVLLVLLVIGVWAVVGVLYTKYHKVAMYVCYYGKPEADLTPEYASGNTYHTVIVNGTMTNLDNIKCFPSNDSEHFQCSDTLYADTKKAGYSFLSTSEMETTVTH